MERDDQGDVIALNHPQFSDRVIIAGGWGERARARCSHPELCMLHRCPQGYICQLLQGFPGVRPPFLHVDFYNYECISRVLKWAWFHQSHWVGGTNIRTFDLDVLGRLGPLEQPLAKHHLIQVLLLTTMPRTLLSWHPTFGSNLPFQTHPPFSMSVFFL